VLKGIFGSKKNEGTGGWRKIHNEKLNNFYSSPNIIRMIKSVNMSWATLVAVMGRNTSAYKYLVRKTESLGRARYKWEDNNKIDMKEIERDVVNCIHQLSKEITSSLS
jgi:acyl-coenzyme A synthetase/AMP-(fatty) acid ligase